MKSVFFSLMTIILLLVGCEDEQQESYPKCLQLQIDSISTSSPVSTPPANIKLYVLQEENVYVVGTYIIADGYIYIYNAQCEIICFWGGFAGTTFCKNGVNWNNAKYIKTVWTDNR